MEFEAVQNKKKDSSLLYSQSKYSKKQRIKSSVMFTKHNNRNIRIGLKKLEELCEYRKVNESELPVVK